MIRFETEVLRVEPVNGKWRVQSKTGGGFSNDEIYDAVVMCCGHFAEPNIAQIPGKISKFSYTLFQKKLLVIFFRNS